MILDPKEYYYMFLGNTLDSKRDITGTRLFLSVDRATGPKREKKAKETLRKYREIHT
jgi:beta-galactosidase beta subunit